MTDSTGGSLNAAYEAIKAKDLAKARDVLSAYLVDNPNDVDAWWLYSYAVTDVEQGRKALETVLRLDPAYPGARDLLTELEEAAPAHYEAPAVSSLKPLSEKPRSLPSIEESSADDIDAEFGFENEDEPATSGFSRIAIAAIAAIAVLALVAAVLILPNLNNNNPAPTTIASTIAPTADVATESPTIGADTTIESATAEASVLAVEATDVSGQTSTEEAPTTEAPLPTQDSPEPTADGGTGTTTSDDAVYSSLNALNVVPDSAIVEPTQLGQTQAVSVCAVNSEIRTLIPAALTAIARISSQLPADTQAVGVKFVNCTDNSVLRYVALNISDAQAYESGTLSDTDIRSRFVALP